MSLADVYTRAYGEGSGSSEAEKTAEDAQIESALSQFSEEDCVKLAAAAELIDAFELPYENGVEKLAQAANIVDHFSQEVSEEDGAEATTEAEVAPEVDSEKLAAEYDAAGRIMAQGFMKEMNEEGEVADQSSFASRMQEVLSK